MSKLFLFALASILLILSAYSWEQFNNDNLNTAKANGTGYFNSRSIINLTDSLNGMVFQPLVSDIDNNGKNDIIIFYGNYLKIFDNKLSLVNEKNVGKLQGQPIIFNIDNDDFKEIVFISNFSSDNFSSKNYFFIYEYGNTGFKQEFNLTVDNGGIGSGIKCTAIGTTKACIFMDNAQYIHFVNLSSKTGTSYNTSIYNDTQEKIPAIGDLHNNGGLQAVFWFDENNNNRYGIMVFDLIAKNFDFSFNNNGIMDDIVQSLGASFVLKGHPVLVDLNNDNQLEIAISAFYNDAQSTAFRDDSFTHLWVFNDSGAELFNKCESGFAGCNDNTDPNNEQWEGTNPFVLDADNNNINDICFIKDKKINNKFKNMTINCYNYSGNVLLDAEITPSTSTIKTAVIADMNNDNILDIITENNIYYKNGSSFFAHGFGSNFAIPVDIDGNEGLDLLLSKDSETKIFIDNFDSINLINVSISSLIPSSEDSLSCSFVVEGDGNLKANVSWYNNNILQLTENNIECSNGTKCAIINPILSNLTSKDDVWKCNVVAFNESLKSYENFDFVKILEKKSEWSQGCNAKNNDCKQSGISYFSNEIVAVSDNFNGMEFEPLVSDINYDGKNEIIIFSNEKLIIFNHSLGLINEKNVGNLVGQPTIYNIDNDDNLEIIFMVNVSSTSRLMAYEYNNNFTKQCNVTISNGASGSGIKCISVGYTQSCFFKDQKNVFYNFNMSNLCTQIANLTTNNNEDTKPTVPAILDYDLDGKMEGLWWFNNDSDKFIGIVIVELETMNFDNGFNNIGFIDDVTQGSGTDYRAGSENLKGNPVFYQQDNAGSYEILTAYDNENIAGMIGDEFQCFRGVIKAYDTDGTLLWTKRPTTCEQASTGTYNCDISTPVIVDADKDGYEDVCFIMDGDSVCYQNAPDDYFYCLDRFGNNIDGYPKNTSDVNLYGSLSADLDTPLYVADMDNDNNLDMIGSGYIWELNGSILKGNYSSFTKFAPVPVDVDKNGVLELLGTKVNQTYIFYPNANICSGRIQVQSVEHNNNPIANTNVFVNGVLKGTTDDFGLFESQESSVCGESLVYTLKCENNTVVCEIKSTALDVEGDFDYLGFDCSVCGQEVDMELSINKIKVNKNSNEVTVNITIINIPTTPDINITFKVQDNDGLISREESQLFNINSNDRFKFITQSITLTGNDDFVHMYVDPENKINENDEKNNYVLVPLFEPQINAYLNITTGYDLVDNKIKDYLKLFVNEKSKNGSDVTIAVGLPNKNEIINNKNSLTKEKYKWYFDDRIYFNNKPLGSKPYNGLVGSFFDDFNYIFVGGNDIDGLVAAIKRLISARKLFFNNFNKDKFSVIEDTDFAGISVTDLLRSPSNFPYYEKRGTIMFANVVERVLKDNNFEVSIRSVKSYNDNTTLRVKNVKSDFSLGFKEAVVGNKTPVVFSGGLFSNLFRWEENNGLARQLAQEGRDTWEIEMTGGPNTECPTCPNYQYEDLVDYYWPALIAGVEKYSGENTIQYVGHSNGCRVALDSLKNWSATGKSNAGYYFDTNTGKYLLTNLASNPIDVFVGVGCPGAFEGTSPIKTLLNLFGNTAIQNLKKNNISHIALKDVLASIPNTDLNLVSDTENTKISVNLFEKYVNFASENNDNQPGEAISLGKLAIIHGDILVSPSDGVVTLVDSQEIYNNITAGKKKRISIISLHSQLPDSKIARSLIKKTINNESFTFWNNLFVVEEELK